MKGRSAMLSSLRDETRTAPGLRRGEAGEELGLVKSVSVLNARVG